MDGPATTIHRVDMHVNDRGVACLPGPADWLGDWLRVHWLPKPSHRKGVRRLRRRTRLAFSAQDWKRKRVGHGVTFQELT